MRSAWCCCCCSCPAGSQLEGQLARPEFISLQFLRRFVSFCFFQFQFQFAIRWNGTVVVDVVVLHVVDIFIRCGLKTVAAFLCLLPLSEVISAWPSALKKKEKKKQKQKQEGRQSMREGEQRTDAPKWSNLLRASSASTTEALFHFVRTSVASSLLIPTYLPPTLPPVSS